MKVLVTGANGLLASNLIRVLAEAGYEVRGMVRASSSLKSLEGAEYEIFRGEICNREDVFRAARGCRIIVHAAANTNHWPTGIEHYRRINVEATGYIIEAARKEEIEKLVFVSTANTFGFGSMEDPADESFPFTFSGYKSGYIQSKYEAQQLVLSEAEKTGMPAVVVNPTFMLGPHDAKPSSGTIVLMSARRKIMASPPGGKNFVHVKDVAIGILNAIRKGKDRRCYILAGENLRFTDFFRKVREVTGCPEKIVKIPPAILRGMGWAGSFAESVLRRTVPLNHTNARLLCEGLYYTPARAVSELGMPQTPVEKGIEDAWKWFVDNKYIYTCQ